MSIHYLPDPHPGRCLNTRPDTGDPYRVKRLRCLEAEASEHVCRFPEPSKSVAQTARGISYVSPEPVPWVVP